MNISGGTEVGACFLSVALTAPTKPVSLGFPALGQAMDVYSPEGEPLRGEVGELVCTRAWPGMTRGIWGDDERYLETYWRRFPGVWTHGDWASVDEDGYWFLHGRSDDTLNIAGKRIGPAELESAALDHPSVAEAAAIGVPHEVKGETAWIFVALKPGAEEDADGIKAAVAAVARQGVRTGADPLRLGAAEDALGQDRPPRGAGEGARRGSRRPFDPGEPRDPGGDRECRLEHWSPEADAGSAPDIARELAGDGWDVTVTGRTAAQVEEVAAEIGGTAVVGDVSKREDVERMLAEAGPIDLLVANAGIALWEESWETDIDEWWHVFEVNVLGAYLTCRARAAGDDRARRRPDRDHRQRRLVPARLDVGRVQREQGGRRPLRRGAREAGQRTTTSRCS